MQPKISTGNTLPLCLFLFFVGLFVTNTPAFAQVDPELQAKQLFEEQKYQEALPVFDDLARLYPTDPELNYYYGACLVETGQFTEQAKHALLNANGTQNSNWYLAQYYHSQRDWDNAMTKYLEFQNAASAKDFKSVNFSQLFELCQQHINPFATATTETATEPDTVQQASVLATPEIILSVPDSTETLKIEVTEPSSEIEEQKENVADSLISFPVNAQVTYLKLSQFKSDEGKESFLQARKLEKELNEKLSQSKTLRDKYELSDELAKAQLVDSILKLEQQTYQLNQQVADADQKANQLESSYWDKAGLQEIAHLQEQNQQIKDSIAKAEKPLQEVEVQPTELLIIDATDSLAMDTLTVAPEPVDEILYKIQIGAYRNTPPPYIQSLYKKLSVLRRIDQYKDENGVTVYTVGELKKYEDARQMLKQIKLEGVNNASIVAYKNKVRIPVEEAKKITEE